MNIVFSSDKNYAQLMGVAICSIFENKKFGYPINIYVLDGGISKIDINRLKILENKYKFEIKYIKINTSFYKDFHTTNFFSQAVYYRIMIPRLLPHLKKVLYLDCDIVVLDDIYDLYSTNIDNYAYAAAEDVCGDKERHEELNIPLTEKYFNSGVLLINIEKCNETNAPETIIKYTNDNPDKLKYVDQDSINATMWGKILCVDQKYNYRSFYTKPDDLDKLIKNKDIKIIHYFGEKPWNHHNENVLVKQYFIYLKKTPWKNFKYINLYKGKMKLFFMKLSSNLEKKLPTILTERRVAKLRKLKRKLGVKFY